MTTAVAVALYNGERFVERQLDSLREQTRRADQVVLCDDGSKDNTVQIVEEYIRRNGLQDSWKLYRNETNLGYIRNFYRAISLCDAELVFLSDQDDIWKKDKIQRMTEIMEQRREIDLLSCRYGIIDAKGEAQHSLVEPDAKEDGALHPVTVQDIMTAYRWPGMLMCLRKTFFEKIYPCIENSPVPHDLMFVVCAADGGGFYDYNYVGAYHRRHDNNTAREEHRVFKLLNLQRKLTDISVMEKQWSNLLSEELPIGQESRELIGKRLSLLRQREQALKNRSLSQVLRVYKEDGGALLRKASLLCDIWLVCFGKYEKGT